MASTPSRRGPAFYLLAAFFALFVIFLYGPMLIIFVLSFQGPTGGLTFPMRGVSTHWFQDLWSSSRYGDLGGALRRSIGLGVISIRMWSPPFSLSRSPLCSFPPRFGFDIEVCCLACRDEVNLTRLLLVLA